MRRKLWKANRLTPQAEELGKKHNLSPVLAQVLIGRDLEGKEFDSFLSPSLSALHSPRLLPDIDKACARIRRAVKSGEKIFIIGDYDVDGITSLAVFYEFIKNFPRTFSFYLPHRIKDGYGLNKDAIAQARKEKAGLIVSFDCGTNAAEELALARSYAIDLIIIDHHQPKGGNEDAFAFVNPKRKDTKYPFVDLSSAALSFKLLQVLSGTPCWEALDLVALSLICDVAPLKGENRILLKEGLEWLRKSCRPAIKALCKVSSIKQEKVNFFHLGYVLGPRINAAGRVADAKTSLDIFLTDDQKKAEELALDLQGYNRARREIEREVLAEAERIAESAKDDYALIVYGDSWHPGVLGIVASRLADKYYRPSFVISFEDGIGRGSARSIHSVDLIQALDHSSDFLLSWGGHKRAAGIEIAKDRIGDFKRHLNKLIKKNLSPEDLIPVLDIDLTLGFGQIDLGLVEELEKLKPLGEGNPEAVFLSKKIIKKSPAKKMQNGYSLYFEGDNRTFEGIVYDRGLLGILDYADRFDLVYSLRKNNYHNVPVLVIRDCRLSEEKR